MQLLHLFLAMATTAVATTSLTDWEQIHQTLHRYASIIDMKDIEQLDKVFSPNARANYTAQLSDLNGLPAIKAGLAESVSGLQTQHLLGTTIIDQQSSKKANSTTYFQASLFPNGGNNLTTLLGLYADELSKGSQGWRIDKRQLLFQGSFFQMNAVAGQPAA